MQERPGASEKAPGRFHLLAAVLGDHLPFIVLPGCIQRNFIRVGVFLKDAGTAN